jgi:hypothetical protein
MTVRDAAIDLADSTLAMIPELVLLAVRERRKLACWRVVYLRERERLAWPAWRWIWVLPLRRARAACAANRELQQRCETIASMLASSRPIAT